MADRVHPGESPQTASNQHSTPKPAPPPEKPVPQPGTYVIQIPKEQVYRVPPPENARRFDHLSKRKPQRRGTCFRCCCCILTTILVLIFAVGIAAGVLYFVFKPKAPKYSIESVAIKGFNLNSSKPISPEFNVTVRANNPNHKIGIYYEKGSSVEVFHEDVNICNGELPAFYQPTKNVTIFQTVLKSSGIELNPTALRALSDQQNKGAVPFKLELRAPVKIKVGSLKTWKITVKVTCKIKVDKLTAAAKILPNSKDCDYRVKLW